MKTLLHLLVASLCLPGCALVPKSNQRLDLARSAYLDAKADSRIAIDAAPELEKAAEVLARASTARDTLDDSAVVDHLAYMAKQRVAIAREVAGQRASQRAIDAAWKNVRTMATYRQENP
jgi:hypothetical protein